MSWTVEKLSFTGKIFSAVAMPVKECQAIGGGSVCRDVIEVR